MNEVLKNIDQSLFFAINAHHTAFWDELFWWISNRFIWIPFYLLCLFYIIKKYQRQAVFHILAIILAVGFADFIASGIIKPWVKRLRPSHLPQLHNSIHILHNYSGGEFGMASSHAANSMAFATIIWLFYQNKIQNLWLIFGWSILVSYSRVYIGVHYPGDILVGWLIGICSATLFYTLLNKLLNKKNV